MGSGSARRMDGQRIQLAQVAARLMHESGIRDFRLAKEKAAAQLGLDPRKGPWPKNTEIESALAEHLRLFAGQSQPEALRHRREAAVQAMRLFAEFRPRLVGDVLSGLATEHSDVQLHVFADSSEYFDFFLQSQGIPFDLVERRLRLAKEGHAFYTAFVFSAGDVGFEAIIFPLREMGHPPRSLVDGAPMQRAALAQVEQLLTSNTNFG